jgi:glycosyltransferase involved in cell wall biosynthesis
MDSEREPIAAEALSVILLAHNDAPDLEEVVKAWLQVLDERKHSYGIILVTDGSSDGTGAKADVLAAQFPQVRVSHHVTHGGMGAALRTGLAAAATPLVFYTLANRQYRPSDLKRLLDHIDKVDLVVGYRVWQPVPAWRQCLDALYSLFMRVLFGVTVEPRETWLGAAGWGRRWLARWLFGVRVPDPQCPFALFRRSLLARIPIQCDSEWASVEVIAKANFLNAWLTYAPITWVPPQDPVPAPSRAERRRLRRDIRQLLLHPDFGPTHLVHPEVQPEAPSFPVP